MPTGLTHAVVGLGLSELSLTTCRAAGLWNERLKASRERRPLAPFPLAKTDIGAPIFVNVRDSFPPHSVELAPAPRTPMHASESSFTLPLAVSDAPRSVSSLPAQWPPACVLRYPEYPSLHATELLGSKP